MTARRTVYASERPLFFRRRRRTWVFLLTSIAGLPEVREE